MGIGKQCNIKYIIFSLSLLFFLSIFFCAFANNGTYLANDDDNNTYLTLNTSDNSFMFDYEKNKDFDRLIFKWSQDLSYRVHKRDNELIITFRTLSKIHKDIITSKLPPNISLKAIQNVVEQNILILQFTVPQNVIPRHYKKNNAIILDIYGENNNSPIETPSSSIDNPPQTDEAPQPINNSQKEDLSAQNPNEEWHHYGQELLVDISTFILQNQSRGLELRFPWIDDVGSAVFRRANAIWIVFDQPASLNLERLIQENPIRMENIQQIRDKRITILRIVMDPKINPTIRKEGTSWIIRLQEQPLRAISALNLRVEYDTMDRASIHIPLIQAAKTFDVIDPEVGDRIYITPIYATAKGIAEDISYIEFDLLQTIQGIGTIPKLDGLWIGWEESSIQIKNENGLLLSKNPDLQIFSEEEVADEKLFEIKKWQHGGVEHFLEKQYEFNEMLKIVAADEINRVRFEMAKFYFSYNMPENTLGLLRLIEQHNKIYPENPDFIAIYGASNFYMGYYPDATKYLFDSRLDSFSEISFWRGAVLAAEKKWEDAENYFLDFTSFQNENYPEDVTTELSLYALETALMTGKTILAEAIIENLPEKLSGSLLKQKEYLHATLLWLQGRGPEARRLWANLRSNINSKMRAKALLAYIESSFIDQEIEAEEAIEKLEQLRFIYRGEGFEFELLSKLGNLYLDNGQPIKGLKSLKTALIHYPQNPQAAEIAQKMQDYFISYLLNDKDGDSSIIKSIAMFREFQELTPNGIEGNEILSKLADRLIEMDLLDHASKVLLHLITERVHGDEKIIATLKLVVIYLDNQESLKALNTLKELDLPDSIDIIHKQQYHQLLAKSLANLGQTQEALALIENDHSKQALFLKAEIYWSLNMWGKAATIFENITISENIEKKLTDPQARTILNWAMALALDKNISKLRIIEHDYNAMMNETKYYNSFLIALGKSQTFSGSLQQEAQQLASADLFDAFMESYKNTWLTKKNNINK